jgi:predicted transposase/invertase (TIGR01784 family)
MNKYLNEEMTIEERYKFFRSVIKNLTIFDDIFMRKVLEDRECTEFVLQVIMDKKDLKIKTHTVETNYTNLEGHSAIMDCVAYDDSGKVYDIEIQKDSDGASPKRARYYSSLLDSHHLAPGMDFDKLPESYVIFITAKDTLGYSEPICHIDRIVRETHKSFGDESHIIYVDSSKQNDTQLGRLMQDLHCKEASKFHSKVLGARVARLKERTEDTKEMCKELNDFVTAATTRAEANGKYQGILEGRLEGRLEGESIGKKSMAMRLYEKGTSIDDISDVANVSVAQVEQWLGLQTV